jgi:hypothetical protein
MSKDQYSVVQLLLKYGADSMKLDANGLSPIEEAFSRGYAQIVLVLLEHAARLDSGFWPLRHVSRRLLEEAISRFTLLLWTVAGTRTSPAMVSMAAPFRPASFRSTAKL